MATETLNVSGLSASDSGDFSGNVTDIDEAIASADGNVMSSSADGEGETLRVALTNTSASITDDSVITNVSVTLRCAASGTGMRTCDFFEADDPESESSGLIRFRGIDLELAKRGGVVTKHAHNTARKSQHTTVAVYLLSPAKYQKMSGKRNSDSAIQGNCH